MILEPKGITVGRSLATFVSRTMGCASLSRRCGAAVVGVLALVGAPEARAAPPPTESPPSGAAAKPFKPGWRGTLELGGGAPFGQATRRRELAELTAPTVVLGLDFAFRPLRRFDFGLASTFGIATARARRCPGPSVACTLSLDILSVLRARYHFSPLGMFEPWAGLGAGIDFLTNEGQGGNRSYYSWAVTDYYLGPVLQGHTGFGYRVRPTVSLGLLVDVALGSYTSVSRAVRGAEKAPIHDYLPPDEQPISSRPRRGIDGPPHLWLLVKGHVTFETP